MEINLLDFGSEVQQNKKEVLLKLAEFCNQNYPYKKNIKIILLNSQSDSELESNPEKLCILTKNQTLLDMMKNLTNKWINFFIISKRVNLAGNETEVLIHKFLEINGNYRRYF